jgi:Collagen triple helix repeat (20 copies)
MGPEGPKGAKGETGAVGAKGDTGPAGAKGETGLMGPEGPAGAMGKTGSAGAKGEPGAMGPEGPKGAKGETGATGAKGDPGPTGLTGAKGATGLTGPPGLTGPAGAPAEPQSFSTEIVNSAGTSAAGSLFGGATVSDSVTCPVGTSLTGGGYSWTSNTNQLPNGDYLVVTRSYADGNTWRVVGTAKVSGWRLSSNAVCATFK